MAEWVQLIVQNGLLAYVVVWWTQVGSKSLIGSIDGVRAAIDKNTSKLCEVERLQGQHTAQLERVAELLEDRSAARPGR